MTPLLGLRSLGLALLAIALLVSPSQAGDASDDMPSLDDTPHITIVGTARVEAQPDLATITMGVTAERSSAKAAADEVRTRATALIGTAKGAGVPQIDIATQSVMLTQTFDPIRDERGNEVGRRPRGFAAENIIAIKMRDFAKASTLAEDLIAHGANRFDGVEFSVEHPEPIIDKLVGTAVRNARAQAEIAAEAAGVRLGRVLVIERPGEGEASRPMYRRKMAAAPASMPLEAGTKTFSTSIEVTWAIGPR